MDINLKYNFHKSLILPINNKNYCLNKFITKEWQLILMSDGSFTQTLISLTRKKVNIKILKQYKQQLISNNNIREIWLQDYYNNKLAFAKSSWPLFKPTEIHLPNNKPIGQSLIELQADMYKDIHEIYYGYSKYLEYKFNCNGPMWGRKYTIYYKQESLTTVQEIFSPILIEFFTK